MKSKTFVLLIISAFISAVCVLATCMILTQKVREKTYDWRTGVTNQGNAMTGRQEKADFLSQNNLPFNAFIIGGSKAGALKAETFEKYSDKRFYNFYVSSGNFRDFGLYANFMLNKYKGSTKEIVLHLSSHESEKFSRIPFIPIQMQKNLFSKVHSFAQIFRERFLNINTFIAIKNDRKLPVGVSSSTGSRSDADDEYIQKSLKDESKFKNDVLSYWESYDKAIQDLFYQNVSLSACKKNIEELKRIKASCAEKGVKLTVVIGPTFIAELYKYKSKEYAQYLKDIISVVGEVWNFSGINAVDLNPYNFYNGGHCWIFVGDKMIETMYSETPNTSDMDAFGILLNKDNIEQYIENQREKWRELKAEYDETGTIQLQGKSDKSYLGQ